MEKFPEGATISPENEPKPEVTFEEQIELARDLFAALNERDNFRQARGAEIREYVEDNREYDRMEGDLGAAKFAFDEKVADKKGLVQKLRDIGEPDVADTIGLLYGMEEKPKGFLSRWFKK